MHKNELINYIHKKYDVTKETAKERINFFTQLIVDVVSEEGQLNLIEFGAFYTKKYEKRKGRNPNTGQQIDIPEHIQVGFKVSKKFKDKCQKLLSKY